jgi:NAD(P)-dependent dehydrogenase (short-subunit alcohol dehydrogenase family)
VVFGALGALAALGTVPAEQCSRIRSLQADFLRPMFLGVDYRAQTNGPLVRLFDGTSTVVSLTLTLGDVWPAVPERSGNSEFPAAVAAELDNLAPGLAVRGHYGTETRARKQLCRQWGVTAPPAIVDMLLWSSYVIGMELPGKTALFSRLALEIERIDVGAFEYEAAIENVDRRLGQLRIRAKLWRESGTLATAECRAFNRPATPALDQAAIAAELPASNALVDKKALVMGASRGLGAALAEALESQGAKVIAVARSGGTDPGDAADAHWRAGLRAKILAEHGGLDLLIANAFPALLPLSIEENSCARIEQFLSRANAMTVGPLCSFIDLLSQSRGAAILISSVAVEQPVKEWPHYVAAKKAAEALMEVAALQYPEVGFLVVRPEKMLTEMTNTPLGRRNAIAPEHMAVRIVQRILQGINGWQLLR